MMDVKTLSGANELYHEGPHARQRRRGAPVSERARRVNGEYIAKARTLDHEHSRQADGTRYPGVREQVQGHLVGPVLAALRAWDPVLGLVVGSYQGCSEALHGLAREAAKAKATAICGGRWGYVRTERACTGGAGDLSTRTTCAAAGVASSGGRGRASSAAACPSLGGRTPTSFTTARRPRTRTAERLLAGPRRGRRCTPASCAGHARRQAFERLSAGWRVPAEPTMLRLNSHFLGF